MSSEIAYLPILQYHFSPIEDIIEIDNNVSQIKNYETVLPIYREKLKESGITSKCVFQIKSKVIFVYTLRVAVS